jgi:predicted nuclease of predicted toxin-antitoxin system
MTRFLIDVNLPEHFSLWKGPGYLHVRSLNERWTDRKVWDYARRHDLVIVSKDADFSELAMLSTPPPRVVHIRFGNLKLRQFRAVLTRQWPWVQQNISRFRLIAIYADRIEAIADEASD